MRQLVSQMGGQDEEDDDTPQARAQQILDQAFETQGQEQVRLAREALATWPDCADAYVLLAENADTLYDARQLNEQAVAAAERALGPDAFQEYEGHFWGCLETRPYMRARAGLAQCLWQAGEHEQAVTHYQEMLRLNPNDNQGLRYVLASCLLELHRHEELKQLLESYEGDGTAAWTYTAALLAFRSEGETAQAGKLLKKASKTNKHVPAYLLGDRQLPRTAPDFVGCGDENEAAAYVADNLPAWKATPGAITWLRKTLKISLPEPKRTKLAWPDLSKRLNQLPQAEDKVWQIEVRRFASTVEMSDEATRPWTLVIASRSEGEHTLLALDVKEKEPGQAAVLDSLVEAMRRPKEGEPHRPARVEVRQRALLNAWRSKLRQINVECVFCKELEEVDAVLEAATPPAWLARRLSGEPDIEPAAEESDLQGLPQAISEVWQADIRRLPAWVENQGDPQRPWGVLVVSCSEQPVLAHDIRTESPDSEWLWCQVAQAMTRPFSGEPRRPGLIELRDSKWADALRPHLELLDIGCTTCDKLDPLDMVFDNMVQHLADDNTMTALVKVPGVKPQHVAAFFEAAARYYQQAPWRDVEGDTPIRIECEKYESGPWYAVVMGQSGLTLGLALYEDLNVLTEILSGDDGDEENARSTSALSVTYGEAIEIATDDLEAAEEHGWPVAGPEAYPQAMRVNPGHSARPPLAWELELLAGCLTALPEFLKHGTQSATVEVQVVSGELTLCLTRMGEELRSS